MNDWAVIIVIYVTIFVASPLIAVLHELGHGLAWLALTKPDKIDIYIGSYTRPKNAIRFKTGKLRFYIKRSFPFVKGIGLCRSYKYETDYINFIIILLAGPVFTLFAACVISNIAFNVNAPILVKISCYIFLGFSLLSLITNLVPREIEKTGHNHLNSDGKQIAFALRIKKALPEYCEALEFLAKEEYDQTLLKLKSAWAAAPRADEVLELLITTSLTAKQYDNAAFYIASLETKGELTITYQFYKGCLLSLTGRHDEAIMTYSELIKKDKNHVLALNNLGCELVEKGAHQVAKRALDKAIKLKPEFDHPYANLAYSKIVQGDLEEGKALVDKCLSLNGNNADAHKALGVYHLKLKDIALADENFSKAIELDPDLDLRDYSDELRVLKEQQTTDI